MKHDDIRRLLRDADPARGRELPPWERARMRMTVTNAGLQGAARRSKAGTLALVAAGAMVIGAVVALTPRFGRQPETRVAGPTIEIAPPPAVPPPPPAVAKLETEPRLAPAPLRAARRIEPARTTRIDFTAPEGTRILWFVESGDAKELGS